ncbi:MAG: thioredoxin family protein [Planctomycetota bacterium]|jgi:thioredoxin 1|nr:thioredoxin family protein [Planctomycetota bacterium]
MRTLFFVNMALALIALSSCGTNQATTANSATSPTAESSSAEPATTELAGVKNVESELSAPDTGPVQRLPRLVDLGATTCRPCQMMEPILESLREEYQGRMDVVFIDVGKDPKAAEPYAIQSIPTQIYYDAAGTERWRHVGYLSQEDILAGLLAEGVTLPEK